MQVEDIRYSIRRIAYRAAGHDVGVDLVRLVALHRGVIGKRDPDKNSGLRSRECFRDDARTLQRFPGQLQEKALLRVDPPSFARRNSEEPGIELVYVRDEPARPRIHFPGLGRVGMEVRVHVPAVVGYLADGVPPRLEQRPEFLQVCGTREPACQTD